MQTKKIFPKLLLFFYLIPYLAALIFTGFSCLCDVYLYEWSWLAEWMAPVSGAVGDYILFAMVCLFFGIMAYAVFYWKPWQAVLVSGISLLAAFLFPFSRYLVRHLIFGSYGDRYSMLDMFLDDAAWSATLLSYTILALFVILLERTYYAFILRKRPCDEKKILSPKHPIGLSMLIFFCALMVSSTVFFFLDEFAFENIWDLGLEYLRCAAGFFLACFSAGVLSKWTKKNHL